MNGWWIGWMDGWMMSSGFATQSVVAMNGWIDGWMYAWMDYWHNTSFAMNGWIDYRTQYAEWMDERMIDASSLLRHRGWGAACSCCRWVCRSFQKHRLGVCCCCWWRCRQLPYESLSLSLSLPVHCLLLSSIAEFLHLKKPCSIANFSFKFQVASLPHHEQISIIFFTLCLSSFNCLTVDFFCLQFKTKEEGWWQTRILLQARRQSRQESE